MHTDMTEVERMLLDLQRTAFALHEAALFLDSHPRSATALRYHAKTAEEYKNKKTAFEEKWGRLSTYQISDDSMKAGAWQWILTPWPWEVAYPMASDNPDNNVAMKEGK